MKWAIDQGLIIYIKKTFATQDLPTNSDLHHYALQRKHPEIAEFLLQLGIDSGNSQVNQCDWNGLYPLHHSIHFQDTKFLRFLLSCPGINIHSCGAGKTTAFYEALVVGTIEHIKLFFQVFNDEDGPYILKVVDQAWKQSNQNKAESFFKILIWLVNHNNKILEMLEKIGSAEQRWVLVYDPLLKEGIKFSVCEAWASCETALIEKLEKRKGLIYEAGDEERLPLVKEKRRRDKADPCGYFLDSKWEF